MQIPPRVYASIRGEVQCVSPAPGSREPQQEWRLFDQAWRLPAGHWALMNVGPLGLCCQHLPIRADAPRWPPGVQPHDPPLPPSSAERPHLLLLALSAFFSFPFLFSFLPPFVPFFFPPSLPPSLPSYDRGLLAPRSFTVFSFRQSLVRAPWDGPWFRLFGLSASSSGCLPFCLFLEEKRVSVRSHWQGCWGREGRFIIMQGRGRGERVPGPQGLIPELSKTFYQDQKP